MLKKLLPLWRGLAVVFLSLLVAGVMLLDIATQWRSTVDGFFGTQSYVIDTESGSRFQSYYDSATEMMEAAKNFAIKQGREGFVVMKNDNDALPLDKSKSIALFGAAAWKPYMQSAGDLKAGNADRKNLDEALVDAGFTLDQQMKDIYDNILADYTESSRFGNTTITYDNGYVTSPGDLANYQVREVPPDRYTDTSLRSADAGPGSTSLPTGASRWRRPRKTASVSSCLPAAQANPTPINRAQAPRTSQAKRRIKTRLPSPTTSSPW